MRRVVLAAGLFGGLVLAASASAQTAADDAPVGKAAGTFMLRGRGIAVVPEDLSSSTSVGGRVTTTAQGSPEVDLSYFFTDHIALELIAATTEHSLRATNTAIGGLDVGSTWVLPPTITAQYHFMPHERFSPYVGVGLNATFFYSSAPSGPTVKSFSLDNNVGAALQAGFDYNVSGHWFANLDVKQIFLNTTAHLNTVLGPVTAKTSLDPLVVGVGIGYRF